MILAAIKQARADGIHVTVFPEWALSGFLAGPEWLDGSRLRACERGLARIVEASQGLAVILGTVVSYRGRLVGAAVAAEDGRRVAPAGRRCRSCRNSSPPEPLMAMSGLLCAGAVAAMEACPARALRAFHAERNDGRGVVRSGAAERLQRGATGRRPVAAPRHAPVHARSAAGRRAGCRRRAGACCCGTGVVDAGKVLFALAGGTQVRWPDGRVQHAPLLREATLDFTMPSDSTVAWADHTAPRVVIDVMGAPAVCNLSG